MRYFHVDLVLAALIAPAGDAIEGLIEEAEQGGDPIAILELALYCAICSVEAGDRLHWARFARLLACCQLVPSPKPFTPPEPQEIARWRAAALGEATDLD